MTVSGSSNIPNTVVVDTSFWVSTLLRKDSNHVAALSWLSAYLYDQGQLVAPQMLIPETAGAMVRITQDKNLARTAVSNLYLFPFMRLVPVDHMLVDDAADLAITFRLKGADALYVAVARQLGVPLVTFDREQLTRPASIIATIRP
ncbi:MAG TPA: type II toxin-antitoxin system VapC family toxin [Chloroflexia bacterium]